MIGTLEEGRQKEAAVRGPGATAPQPAKTQPVKTQERAA